MIATSGIGPSAKWRPVSLRSLRGRRRGSAVDRRLGQAVFAANRAPRGSIERQASIAVHRAAVADVLRRFHDLFEFDNWLFHNEHSYLAGRIDP